MELTGKCKEDFEKWFYENGWNKVVYEVFEYDIDIEDVWDKLLDSMKFGAIQDFADARGFSTCVSVDTDLTYDVFIDNEFISNHETRTEARTEVVNQFNIEYNKHK